MVEEVSTTQEPRASRVIMPPIYGVPDSAEGMMSWSRALARLEQAQNYWLATTRPDGRPHVAPVWGAWVDEALYFDGLPTTRWGRNLAANPAIAVHRESGDDVVIIEGIVEDLTTDEDLGSRIVAAYTAKYDYPLPEPATSGIFRLRPRTARAWTTRVVRDSTENWEYSTRWHFPEV